MSGSLARPRAQILIAGTVQPGLVSCEINSNNFGRGDTFSAQIAPPLRASWFDPTATAPLDAQIQIGFLPPGAVEGAVSSLPLMIQGGIDTTRWDPIRRTLTIEGRDYSSKLIDYRATVDAFLNNTSSEVVQKLVTAANGTNKIQLTASVSSTSTPIGQYFQIEHKRAGAISHSRETTAWDLMMRLARIESYDLYVIGTTVYFQPQLSDTTTPAQLPIGLTGSVPTAPVMTINLERLAGLTKGIQVEVHSWDSRQRKAYVGLWPPKQSNNPDTQKYAFMRPHLLQADCDKTAKALYAEILAHQRTVTYEMPGDTTLTPRQRVQLTGTSTSWDATYRVDSVVRRFGLDGFTQSVTLRNRDDVAADTDGTLPDA